MVSLPFSAQKTSKLGFKISLFPAGALTADPSERSEREKRAASTTTTDNVEALSVTSDGSLSLSLMVVHGRAGRLVGQPAMLLFCDIKLSELRRKFPPRCFLSPSSSSLSSSVTKGSLAAAAADAILHMGSNDESREREND